MSGRTLLGLKRHRGLGGRWQQEVLGDAAPGDGSFLGCCRCGQCKSLQPCTVADGRCLTCEAGWNGTKCDQPCSPGFYGEGCEKLCPPCKDGHTCNHINGKCSHCNPGWIGDR